MAKSETGGTLSLYRKTRRPGDKALAFCIYLAAALTVCILVGIIGYILVKGVPHISWVLPGPPPFRRWTRAKRDSAHDHQHPVYRGDHPAHRHPHRHRLRHLSDPVRPAGQAGENHPLHHGGALRRALHRVRPVRLHGVLRDDGHGLLDTGRLSDHDHLHPAHHRAYHRGIPAGRSRKLQGGRPGAGSGEDAGGAGHGAPLRHARAS